MVAIRPRRSLLYVPASNAKALDKAASLACDGVILDLEDAVAPELKESARATAIDAVRSRRFGNREVIIRVNGYDTPWGRADLEAIAPIGADAVLVPKVNGGEDISRFDAALAAAPPHTALWAMIETARSVFRLDEIASRADSTRLRCWVMGTNDLAKETRATLDATRLPFQATLSLAVTAARGWGLDIIDGVYNDLDDRAGFEMQCRQGLQFGFDGKTVIHPNQIEPCNLIFTPAKAELEAAQAIVDAFALPENRDKGAVRVAGKMAERLHLDQARRVLALRAAIEARAQ
ncbi:MAG: CoA ester lyase [Steroidobacteraceae bacterium]